ncbi:hypothetical protein [Nonomuraea candida]|nr:hypothetical protein [Nonomuraea candida]
MRTTPLVCGMTAIVFVTTVMAHGAQPGSRPLDPAGRHGGAR